MTHNSLQMLPNKCHINIYTIFENSIICCQIFPTVALKPLIFICERKKFKLQVWHQRTILTIFNSALHSAPNLSSIFSKFCHPRRQLWAIIGS